MALGPVHPSRLDRDTTYDQISMFQRRLLRIYEAASIAVANHHDRDEAQNELSRLVWSCVQLPAGCWSVPPSEMIFMQVRAHRMSVADFTRM